MKKRKKSIREVIGVVILLAAMIGLFQWYTTQNSVQIEERNKNYAADAAQLKADQIMRRIQRARQ